MAWLVAGMLAIPEPASAYLDPGTGSMLLQGLIAAFAAAVAAVFAYWRAVRNLIARLLGKGASKSDGDMPDSW